MQILRRPSLRYWSAPLIGVLIGLLYLIGFSIGGRPGDGLVGFVIMVVFSAGLTLVGYRSETVRGLLDRRDERIAGIDLRATAFTASAMIVAVLLGFIVDVARGNDGWPYFMIGAVGGVAYLAAVIYYRIRS